MRQQVSTQWERVRRFFAEVRDLSAALAALWAPGTGALAAARLAGMLADVGAPGRLGISMALWVVVSFALPAGRKFTEGRPLAQTLAAGAAIGAMLFLTSIARGLLGEQTWSLSVFAEGSAAVGLYGAALALPCCWIFVRLNRLRAVAY